MYQPTKFQQNRAIHGRVIDDLTIFLPCFRAPMSSQFSEGSVPNFAKYGHYIG